MSLTYEQAAKVLKELAAERSEWAGLPMLCGGLDLVVEPKFPYQFPKKSTEGMIEVVNSWFSERLRSVVGIAKQADGSLVPFVHPHAAGAMLLETMMAASVWLFDAEVKALAKLASMIRPHLLQAYILTGCFLESSPRSGVTYMIRRLRPTIAMKPGRDGQMRILTTLCLHPIGYYGGTWAGVMVPTDDAVAHLCMIRGSEAKFWANANQHHPVDPRSGL